MKSSLIHKALEEKNAVDFAAVSARIESAIRKIRSDPKIKPTQAVLAKLAECSRGTINNRKWPLAQLKQIKADRIEAANTIRDANPPVAHEESLVEQYKQRLYNNREELLVWKNRCDAQAQKLTQIGDVNRVLQSRIELLELELLELRKLKSSVNVVDININKK